MGDVIAMIMYAIGAHPLVYEKNFSARRIFFADDGFAAGKLSEVKEWWNWLKKDGPQYGYFPKPAKSILVVKPEVIERARGL